MSSDYEWQRWGSTTVDLPPEAVPNAYLAAVTADNPVGWWHLADAGVLSTALDASLNGHNGSYTGTGVGLTFGEPSLLAGLPTSTCVKFTGGRVLVPTGSWLDFSAGFTAIAWIKPTSVVGNRTIFSHDDDASPGSELAWRARLNAGKLEGVLRTAAGVIHTQLAPTAYLANTVHQIAITYDNATLRLYSDGVQVATKAIVGPMTVSAMPLYIGKLGDYGSEDFMGWIDEPALFAGPLSAARILANYNAGSTPPPAPYDPPPVVTEGWETDADRTSALHAWAPSYGRADINGKATPLQVTVELAADRAGDCPPLGERFRLSLSAARAAVLGIDTEDAVRFTGEVTDARIDPNREPGGVYTLTGVGRLGRAARRTVNPRWPQEDDGARVARILAAADAEAGTIDAGTVDLLPATTRATAGQLLDRVMDSTLGQVIEQPTGAVDWHDADHRRDVPVTVELAASEIVNDLEWTQHVGDVINDLTVTYGNPADTVRAYDPTSIDVRDAFPGSLSTDLVTASDAHSLGTLVIARRREPSWQLPALVIDLLKTVDATKLAQLLTLRHGDRIRVTGFPAGGPYAGTVELFVEGWAESLVRPAPKKPTPRWRLAVAVSDPVLSGVSLRWIDAPVGLTWDAVDPALTWLDVATIDNPADLGA